MKRLGILNSDIARVLAYMGHTDTLAIGDCGLPIPDTTERIDLAIEFGKPSFMDVLKPVSKDMKFLSIVFIVFSKLEQGDLLYPINNIQEGFRNENKEDRSSDSCVCNVIFHSRVPDYYY